jgi:hypothetical protein
VTAICNWIYDNVLYLRTPNSLLSHARINFCHRKFRSPVNDEKNPDVVDSFQEPVKSETLSQPKKSSSRVGQRKQGRDKAGLE